MGISGYEVKDFVAGGFDINEEVFAQDVTFPETPDGVRQEIQIQLGTGAAATMQITFDGATFIPINNNVPLFGLSTFTIYVDNNTALNFRNIDVNALATSVLVLG